MEAIESFVTSPQTMNAVSTLEGVFKNVPHLPKGLRKFFVKIAPWLAGLSGILNVIGGLSSLLNPGGGFFAEVLEQFLQIPTAYFYVTGALQLIAGLFLLLSFSPLKAGRKLGWLYLFWATIVGIGESVAATVFLGMNNIVGMVIGAAFGLYILFELMPHYNKK